MTIVFIVIVIACVYIWIRHKKLKLRALYPLMLAVNTVIEGIGYMVIAKYIDKLSKEQAFQLAAIVSNEIFFDHPQDPPPNYYEFMRENKQLIKNEIISIGSQHYTSQLILEIVHLKYSILLSYKKCKSDYVVFVVGRLYTKYNWDVELDGSIPKNTIEELFKVVHNFKEDHKSVLIKKESH